MWSLRICQWAPPARPSWGFCVPLCILGAWRLLLAHRPLPRTKAARVNRPWLLLADRSSEGLLVGVRVKWPRGLGEPFSGPRVEVCVCSVRELAYEHERSGGRKARRCLDPSTKMFFFSRLKSPLCVKQMRGSRVFILVAKIHIACQACPCACVQKGSGPHRAWRSARGVGGAFPSHRTPHANVPESIFLRVVPRCHPGDCRH